MAYHFIPALRQSTQFATLYDGEKAVATVARRRVYERKTHVWEVFGVDGKKIMDANWGFEVIRAMRKQD